MQAPSQSGYMNITEGKLMLGAIFRDKMLLYAASGHCLPSKTDVWGGMTHHLPYLVKQPPYNSSFRSAVMVYWMGFSKCRLWRWLTQWSPGGRTEESQLNIWLSRVRASGRNFDLLQIRICISISYYDLLLCYPVTLVLFFTPQLLN